MKPSPILETVTVGRHVLMRGDCLQIMPLLSSVDHIITDPPYERITHEAKTTGARNVRKDNGPANRAISFDHVENIRAEIVHESYMASNGWVLLFCSPEGVGRWADDINASSMKYKRACVWVKPDSTPQMNGQGPAMGAEMFVAAWAGKGYAKWNAGGKRGVYTHLTNPSDRHGGHPTEKPVALMKELVTDFTSPGQVVLDPFMGSGSTGIACHTLGRVFVGIEQDEKYFNMAVERMKLAYSQIGIFESMSEKPRKTINMFEAMERGGGSDTKKD